MIRVYSQITVTVSNDMRFKSKLWHIKYYLGFFLSLKQ